MLEALAPARSYHEAKWTFFDRGDPAELLEVPYRIWTTLIGPVTRALEVLKQDGSVHRVLDQMQTREELYGLIGYKPGIEWEWPVR